MPKKLRLPNIGPAKPDHLQYFMTHHERLNVKQSRLKLKDKLTKMLDSLNIITYQNSKNLSLQTITLSINLGFLRQLQQSN